MTCREARDVDLAAFLVDAEGPEWAEFKRHYPECPECAREVGEWMRIENSLHATHEPDAGHVPPDALVRWVRSPEELPAGEREAIQAHLELCRSCADERATLSDFDLSALKAFRRPGIWSRLRSAVGALRGLVTVPVAGPGEEQGGSWLADGFLPEPELALLSKDARAERGAEASPGALLAVLAVLEGESAVRAHPIVPGENRIGRAPDVEIRLTGRALSRVAALIEAREGDFRLVALQEGESVRLNGEPIRSADLADGDVIELGEHRLQLRLVGER